MIVANKFDFKGALRAVRESRGLTQQQLGDMIGESANTISNWEMASGRSRPSLAKFRLLCIALNCPPGDLLGLSLTELSDEEYKLLKGYRALDDAGKHTMMAVLESQLVVRSDEFDG